MTGSPNTAGYSRLVFYNDHDDATLTTSAPAALGFPATDTQNDIRSRVWRTTSAASQSMTGVVPSNRVANHFSMWRLRGHGASLRVQLFSDVGASAQVYDSTATTINTIFSVTDAYTWSTGTNDPFLEFAPFRLYFNDTTYRSYTITWSGTPTNYAYFQASRIVLGKYLELEKQPKFGFSLGMADLTDKNRSMGGSLRTNVGESWRTAQFDLGHVTPAERATLLKIMRYCGTGRSLVYSLYPDEGTELERDYMMLCKFTSLDPLVHDVNFFTKRVQLEEI